jgi:2'-5' RNA ligase
MQSEFEFASKVASGDLIARKGLVRRHPSVSPQHPVIPGLEYRRIHNLFFALRLEGEAAAKAFAISRSSDLGGGPTSYLVPIDCLHVTLHLVAQQEGIPESLIEKASKAVMAVNASSFEIAFDRPRDFVLAPPRHALVLLCGSGLAHLNSFHRKMGEALRSAGFKRVGRSFEPHVTLAYENKPFTLRPIEPVCWKVRRFVLIESPRGLKSHKIRGTWTFD